MDWKIKPIKCDSALLDEYTLFVFIDESGMAKISKKSYAKIINNEEIPEHERYFLLDAVIFDRESIIKCKDSMVELKNEFWPPNGLYNYENQNKKVCLHSRDIRRKTGPFSLNVINYDYFMERLTNFIDSLDIKIVASFFDKKKHVLKYKENAKEAYCLSLEFIFERIIKMSKTSDKIIVILESRGKEEDKLIHHHIVKLLNHGTYYCSSKEFNIFKGVYFNPKLSPDNQKSYYGLEIADLCAYPLYRYAINKQKTIPTEIILKKLDCFPYYKGKGFKIFP